LLGNATKEKDDVIKTLLGISKRVIIIIMHKYIEPETENIFEI